MNTQKLTAYVSEEEFGIIELAVKSGVVESRQVTAMKLGVVLAVQVLLDLVQGAVELSEEIVEDCKETR